MNLCLRSKALLLAIAITAALVGCWLSASAASAADTNGPQPVSLSERVDAEARRVLSNVKTTSYSHTTHVDASQGLYEVDCSGFVDLLFKSVSPKQLKDLKARHSHKRPLADDYEQAFEEAPAKPSSAGWQHIAQIGDAVPGDILAWKNPAHKTGEHTNTGHVVVIDERPVEDPAALRQVSAGEKVYRVRVIDSTASPHGYDTRPEGQSGVGRGVIWLITNAAGKPIGYRWKNPRGPVHEAPMAIGRAVGSN